MDVSSDVVDLKLSIAIIDYNEKFKVSVYEKRDTYKFNVIFTKAE